MRCCRSVAEVLWRYLQRCCRGTCRDVAECACRGVAEVLAEVLQRYLRRRCRGTCRGVAEILAEVLQNVLAEVL
ncbi:MAG: hypothetical protein K6G88_12505 [Lachnospiraceae bacterium]|nr:hypothetical protein [Lachnospiraceae bacterium]